MPDEVILGSESGAGAPASAEQTKTMMPAATGASTPRPPPFLMPPQGGGAPRRLFSTGSPASETRLNVAMKVLRDPVARASFSRVYSGQARNWSR